MKIALLIVSFLFAHFAYGQNPDVGYLNGELQKRLEQHFQKLKIPSLSDFTLSKDETEIRLTVFRAFSLPKLFIIKFNEKQNAALLIIADHNNPGRRNPIYKQKRLKKPKRGWKAFKTYIKKQSVDPGFELSLDKEVFIDPDSGFIILEAKFGSAYHMVWYPFSSESVDKSKALNVCQRIEQDFNIRLYCK